MIWAKERNLTKKRGASDVSRIEHSYLRLECISEKRNREVLIKEKKEVNIIGVSSQDTFFYIYLKFTIVKLLKTLHNISNVKNLVPQIKYISESTSF